jgi:hypothetical protein
MAKSPGSVDNLSPGNHVSADAELANGEDRLCGACANHAKKTEITFEHMDKFIRIYLLKAIPLP